MADYSNLLAEVKPGLDSPRAEGSTIWSYCPAHPDGAKHRKAGSGRAGRSLSVDPEKGLKCWNGCTDTPEGFKRVVDLLRGPERSNGRVHSSKSGEKQRSDVPEWHYGPPAVEYEYRDPQSGDLVGVKGRWNGPVPAEGGKPPKEFRWKKPNTPWGKHLGVTPEPLGKPMTDLPLYHAREIFEADPSRRVWFTEGEKAADTLREQGELATCGPWSGSQKSFGTALEVLAGRDVYLWPDNDPIGNSYMQLISMALRGIARRLVVVRAPVPPNGDAYEYFKAGGTVKKLLAELVIEPVVDHLSYDHYIVRLPDFGVGVVAFDFDGMTYGAKQAVDCRLTVRQTGPNTQLGPFTQRINVVSGSARSSLATVLKQYFDTPKEVNWLVAVTTAASLAEQTFRNADRGIQIGQLPTATKVPYLIDSLLPIGKPTLLFGDGASGKTYLAYSMALAIAMGEGHWQGFQVNGKGGVLVVDYETGEGDDTKHRLQRLMRGLYPKWGPDLCDATVDELPFYFWEAEGALFAEIADAIREFCDRKGVTLVIIDAGADAAGQPRDDESVLAFFNALAKVGRTSIVIHHQTNPDPKNPASQERPYGSRYWHNRSRRTWKVAQASKSMANAPTKDIVMSCRKVNDGPWIAPVKLRMHFDDAAKDDPGAVVLERQSASQDEWEGEGAAAPAAPASLADAIADLLHERGPLRVYEIMYELDAKEGSVKGTLYRGAGERWEKVTVPGEQVRWRAL